MQLGLVNFENIFTYVSRPSSLLTFNCFSICGIFFYQIIKYEKTNFLGFVDFLNSGHPQTFPGSWTWGPTKKMDHQTSKVYFKKIWQISWQRRFLSLNYLENMKKYIISRFNTTGISELVLDWQFLTKIWKPDTTFLNGQKCYLHKITVPNRFIRISPSGRVSYSQVMYGLVNHNWHYYRLGKSPVLKCQDWVE